MSKEIKEQDVFTGVICLEVSKNINISKVIEQ